jgi:IS605 OrfB family transposase
VKLIVNLKLKPLVEQIVALQDTLYFANEAANWISQQAFEFKIFKQFDLHKMVYKSVREIFPLSAQMVVRAIAKVADSYKAKTTKRITFKMFGSIAYDDRIISFKENNLVSIWTTRGRINIPYVMGEHQRELFKFRKGEIDLVRRKGIYYLNCVCDVPEDSPLIPDDILGVDFGVVNIATTSDDQTFSGKDVEASRQKYFYHRQLLQRKASKQSQSGNRPRNVRNLLKRLSGREKDFRKHTNHVISKKLVETAKDTNRAIALEELKGIKNGIKKRAKISGWSFYELRNFIEYKAKLKGVPVYFVDPKYTSQTCSKCGHCEKANRKSQSEFVCVQCSHSLNADFNASLNIRSRAIVTLPQKSENIDFQKSVQVQV